MLQIGTRVEFVHDTSSQVEYKDKNMYRSFALKGEVGVVVDVLDQHSGMFIVEILKTDKTNRWTLVECHKSDISIIRSGQEPFGPKP